MSLTVIATRNVADRVRGFLSSVALEVSTGVYCSTTLPAGARERVWATLSDWLPHGPAEGAVVMVWHAPQEPTTYGLRVLGDPPRTLCDHDAVMLVKVANIE